MFITHELKVEDTGNGRNLYLDGQKIKFVKDFNIKSLSKGMAQLNVEMVVRYPGSNERNNNMNREGMLTVARKLREVLTECEVTKQEAESIAYILLTDIKNSNKAAQKTYMENTKLQSVTDLNQEREFSQIIDEKVSSGKMTINEARKPRGLQPLEEEFDVKLFDAKKDKPENAFQIKIKFNTRGMTYEKLNGFLDKRIIPLREKYPFADIYMDIEW